VATDGIRRLPGMVYHTSHNRTGGARRRPHESVDVRVPLRDLGPGLAHGLGAIPRV